MNQSLVQLFPKELRNYFIPLAEKTAKLQEIRIRANQPLVCYMEGNEYFVEGTGRLTRELENAVSFSRHEVSDILNYICKYSPYAYEEEMRQGFLTAAGGHRIGVAGELVLEGEKIIGMKNIRFLNIRISHEIVGAANDVLPCLYNMEKAYFDRPLYNTLIISPPAFGKTTMLRDLIRQVSDGNKWAYGRTVGVVDERSEIAGSFLGVPQNDVGIRTDVLDNCPKVHGMMMLIRSMSPYVIAIDELGGSDDVAALRKVVYCGCKVIATIHGESLEEIYKKGFLADLLKEKVFKRFVVLKRGNKSQVQTEVFDEWGKKC